jgi:hypothetical protein
MFHLKINFSRMFMAVRRMDLKGVPQEEITLAVEEGMCNMCYHRLCEAENYPCNCCLDRDDKGKFTPITALVVIKKETSYV